MDYSAASGRGEINVPESMSQTDIQFPATKVSALLDEHFVMTTSMPD